ncbi:MAG: DUF4234 domain-containing protein [Thermoleophilaceae bacterium]|nr:DUF4234 domain-containing protein [Thermoleophilaceae bacterium]
MAPIETKVKGGDAQVKVRNPVNSALLSVVTFGIYGIFWWYYANKELAGLGRARSNPELGDNPTMSVLALIPGGFVVIPAIITMLNTPKRIAAAQRQAGVPEAQGINAILVFVLFLFLFPVGIYLAQQELNKVWDVEAENGSGGAAGTLPAADASAAEGHPANPAVPQTPPEAR